jgi:hypothetical protein
MRANAVDILNADPTAQIAGPSEWGWTNCKFFQLEKKKINLKILIF